MKTQRKLRKGTQGNSLTDEQIEALTYYSGSYVKQQHESRHPRRGQRATSFYTPGAANLAKAFAFAMKGSEDEPSTVQQAFTGENLEHWKEAIQSELASLKKYETWKVVATPDGAKPLSTRFVFTRKRDENG